MTTFSELLSGMESTEPGALDITIPETWMQGRTTYGGLSAALCLEAAYACFEGLPPLRSAQVAFIGPAGGKLKLKPTLLRQGKSVNYVAVDMFGEQGLATHTVFCFGKGRDAKLQASSIPSPKVAVPEASERFIPEGFGPTFLQHFEQKLARGARPAAGASIADHHIWVRHKPHSHHGFVGLIALADMPPPAIIATLDEMPPLSSMTWMINFLSESIETEDGWWLMRSLNEHAQNGYASENMTLWNRQGQAIMTAKQNITIFY